MPLYGEHLRNRKVDVPSVRCHFVKIMLLAIPFPDLSPTLIEIPLGPITLPIRWYALAYIAGIILGVWMAGRALARPGLWHNETPAMTKERLEDFTTWLIIGIILVFIAPRWGFYLLTWISFWFVWANIMTTATSLRFEKPKITLSWLIVFPLGVLVGLAYFIWTLFHFNIIYQL